MWLLLIFNFSVAFADVIVDSLMVIQARKNPRYGAGELNAFMGTILAIGGFLGSIIAAIVTEYYDPRYCFALSSFIGLSIAYTTWKLDLSIEQEGLENLQGEIGLWPNFKRNCQEIYRSFKEPEYFSIIIYMVVTAIFVPTFSAFNYFFYMDVIGLTKFTYSMLAVLAFVGVFFGTQLYRKFFMEWEFRTLVLIDVAVELLISPLKLLFIFRVTPNWGIPDILVIIFTKSVHGIMSQCFVFLPFAVIAAKVCPKRIEATSFALLGSISSFKGTLRAWIGTYVNEAFVGVTKDDLSQYWVLYLIGFGCSFIPIAFIWLLPTNASVAELQKKMKARGEEKQQ
jgi:MFS family permease